MRERDLIVLKSEDQYLRVSILVMVILLLMLFFQLSMGCTEKQSKDKSKDNMKGNVMSLLQQKPVYNLKVEAYGGVHFINVNGATVIYDSSLDGQTSVVLPVNHWMRSGENTIGIEVYPPKPGEPFNPNMYVNVEMTVNDNSEPEKIYKVVTLNFSGQKDANKSHIGKSSPSGIYSSTNGFTPDASGDVRVFDVVATLLPLKEYDYKGAMYVERKINIPSSLPLWAFFRSDEIPNYQMTAIDEKDFYNSITPLLDEYKKVQNALANKDIESILPMFEERNRETDMALYLEPGTTAKRLRDSLINTINEKDLALLELDIRNIAFFYLERNKKIASLRTEDIGSAIALNFVNKKKGMGSRSYPLFFRYQNGKYILTR